MSVAPREHDRELSRWISALLDGSLDAQGRASLAARLDTDAAARRVYLEAIDMHCEIADTIDARRTTIAEEPAADTAPLRLPAWVGVGIAAAASLAIVGVAVGVYLAVAPASDPEPAPPAPRAVVATLIDANTRVLVNNDIANPGDEYTAGWYAIEQGAADLHLRSGATVAMRGRSQITLHNSMLATLDHGTAHFRCPPSATGFTVRLLDGRRVVDLGTAFSVFNVPDLGSAVYVHEGVVEMHDPDGRSVGIAEGVLAAVDTSGAWVPADSFDAVLEGDWRSPAAVASLLPQVLEGEGRLVHHETFAGAGADGRASHDRAMRFIANALHEPVPLEGEHENLTLAAWVKLDKTDTAFRVLAIHENWGPAGHFSWDIRRGNALCLAVSGHGNPHYHSPIVLHDAHFGRWMHLAMVYDSERGTVEHYVDGRRVSSEAITAAMPLRLGAMKLGHWKADDRRPLDGAMDDLLMIDAALTAKQIESLWRMGSVATDPQTPGELP